MTPKSPWSCKIGQSYDTKMNQVNFYECSFLYRNFVKTCSITVILVSFDSARWALSNELLFAYSNFLPQNDPLVFAPFRALYLGPQSSPWKKRGTVRLSTFYYPIYDIFNINIGGCNKTEKYQIISFIFQSTFVIFNLFRFKSYFINWRK